MRAPYVALVALLASPAGPAVADAFPPPPAGSVEWATDAIRRALTFTSSDFARHFAAVRPDYTPMGYAAMRGVIREAEKSEDLTVENGSATAVAIAPTRSRYLAPARGGADRWAVRVPLDVTIEADDPAKPGKRRTAVAHVDVDALVMKAGPGGTLAIADMTSKERPGKKDEDVSFPSWLNPFH